jgi:hypothetical protein
LSSPIHLRVRKSARRLANLTCFAVLAGSGVGTGAASAAACPDQTVSTPFA